MPQRPPPQPQRPPPEPLALPRDAAQVAAQTSGAPPPAKRRKSEPALLMALPVAMGGVSDGDDMDDMHSGAGRWSAQEDRNLRAAVAAVGAKHWKRISQEYLGGVRSDVQRRAAEGGTLVLRSPTMS